MIAALDQASLKFHPLGPVDLLETAIERDPIITAVTFRLDIRIENLGEAIRHLGRGDEVAPAKLDAIDAEVACRDIDQTLTKEVGLIAAGPAIGAGRRPGGG